ncbi:abortive infection system antitoxin AbiGi family protein [Paraburkholderia tropica]|uniref:abortive infection system antitoxin AbiGi family protein n=1 Tax=Paraburkholderia tropica TaxID=92647 RepID=UPI002AB0174C|nr:abortive infection system antitoxin AbiGi family protein [Paraburkholderia tropica]
MGSLHPDILFHFTSRNGLFGILQHTFTVSYARERIVGNRKAAEFAAPMVSFCDLRLSELKDHMSKYGSYGIGLSKDWANNNGLNPVFYVNKHCSLASKLIAAVEHLHKQLPSISDGDEYQKAATAYMDIINTYRYIKNYEGELIRKSGPTTRNYRFADEREWRYVPPLEATLFPFVGLDKITTTAQKNALNQQIAHLRLEFEPEDIRYLIVERDEERLDLIHHLETVKWRFDEGTRRRLASRILTADQIEHDV